MQIRITEGASERLRQMAREERRRPQDQAGLLLERAILGRALKTSDRPYERRIHTSGGPA